MGSIKKALRPVYFVMAVPAGLVHAFLSYLWSVDIHASPHLKLLGFSFVAGAVTAFAIRVLFHRFSEESRALPYFIWALAALLTSSLFTNQPPDRARFLPALSGAAGARPELRLELNYETRTCFELTYPESMTMESVVPPHARLVMGVGVNRTQDEAGPDLFINVTSSQGKSLVEKRFSPDCERSCWKDYSVDLSGLAGKEVNIIIRAAPGALNSEGNIYVSNPRIIASNPEDPKPNVVFIVADTLRADAVSYHREGLTPALAGLASRGVRFTRHYAQSSWTSPSIASMLTGKMPVQTGVLSSRRLKLAPQNATLAEVLQEAGWRTAGFSSNPFINSEYNYDQGFDSFNMVRSSHLMCLDIGENVTRQAVSWLKENGKDPFFMFVLYVDPHDPYVSPFSHLIEKPVPTLSFKDVIRTIITWGPYSFYAPFKNPQHHYVDAYRKMYSAEVNYVDRQVGKLIGAVEEAGLVERTLVIFTSDHGEGFLERNFLSHGYQPYEEMVHVPFIISGPGCKKETVDHVTSNLDVLPTVLSYLGIHQKNDSPGNPLLGTKVPNSPGGIAYTEVPEMVNTDAETFFTKEQIENFYFRAAIKYPLKAIERLDIKTGNKRIRFYDLSRDPREKDPYPGGERERFDALEKDLTRFFETLPGKADIKKKHELDPGTKKLLKSLGYINN